MKSPVWFVGGIASAIAILACGGSDGVMDGRGGSALGGRGEAESGGHDRANGSGGAAGSRSNDASGGPGASQSGGVSTSGAEFRDGGTSETKGLGGAMPPTDAGGKGGAVKGGSGGSAGKDGSTSQGGASGKGGGAGRGGAASSGGTNSADGGTAGSGGSSNSGKGGSGGTAAGDCSTPPEPSPLIGWASVSGNGVTSTTGGGNTAPTTVSTLADLQTAVKGTTAAVIYVKGKLEPGKLSIGSNKTIVGLCGAEIHGHLSLSKSSNVIIRNIKIVGYGVGDCSLDPDFSSGTGCSSGNDAISVQGQSHHIWFDHDDISDGTDGNLDITHASDYITISWTKFHYTARTDNTGSDSTGASGHRYCDLVGHSDDNASEDTGHLRITWHHDWWADNVVERQPRVRFGQVHLFNNVWSSAVANYCIGVGAGANLRTENNLFLGVKTPINTASYSDSTSAVVSSGNVYTNTSGSKSDLNANNAFDPSKSYSYQLDGADGLQAQVQSGAGPH